MRDTIAIQKSPSSQELHSDRSVDGIQETRFNLADHIHFFQTFIRKPSSVGALSPSSPALAKAMIRGLALQSADTVVEMGPGTGSFTGPILKRIGRHTTFIALELDESHARRLSHRFPKLSVYNDSAENVKGYLAVHRKEKANCIISGLPWASLAPAVQTRIMDSIIEALVPDGVFTTFAYVHARWLPRARQYRRRLENLFCRVEISPVVWKNLPPAFVYRCSRPKVI
ncbi:MAG: methyltransferase [Verrucomicrobia bacterium]|nr:methyltransferase [Verrucomicrobiota bacterium]